MPAVTAVLPGPGPLTGATVVLRPLAGSDLAELAALVADPAVYRSGYVMHRTPTTPDDAARVARSFLPGEQPDSRGGGRTAYAVRLVADGPLGAAGTLVGTSSLGEVDLRHEKAHLGWTLYGPRWWGTAVNPEAKLLLLTHCFDACGLGRVRIQTDLLNTRSQAAIAKLGAVREGVVRRDVRREDGTWRDTVMFSVVREEWPQVAEGLRARLA